MDALDNHLVRQKDHILSLVREDNFEEALTLLKFVRPMWTEFNYLYKFEEIKAIIVERLRQNATDVHWKTEQKWLQLIDKVLIEA